jgi:hypothetical protein
MRNSVAPSLAALGFLLDGFCLTTYGHEAVIGRLTHAQSKIRVVSRISDLRCRVSPGIPSRSFITKLDGDNEDSSRAPRALPKERQVIGRASDVQALSKQ